MPGGGGAFIAPGGGPPIPTIGTSEVNKKYHVTRNRINVEGESVPTSYIYINLKFSLLTSYTYILHLHPTPTPTYT